MMNIEADPMAHIPRDHRSVLGNPEDTKGYDALPNERTDDSTDVLASEKDASMIVESKAKETTQKVSFLK